MKKQNGMTIVETIVAFSILLLAISIFYGTVKLSSKLISEQNNRRLKSEEMVGEYYKGSSGLDITYSLISDSSTFNSEMFSDIKLKKISDSGKELYYYEK